MCLRHCRQKKITFYKVLSHSINGLNAHFDRKYWFLSDNLQTAMPIHLAKESGHVYCYKPGPLPSSSTSTVQLSTNSYCLKGLKGKARIPTDDLIPKTRRGRNQHSLAFQIPSASKDVYQHSFFPQTIRDWNDLPESLISSSELSDDSVSKFTSLVRARD